MTPTTLIIVIFAVAAIFAYLISKLIDALILIARRIESTNMHLDEIRTETAELAQIISTSLVELHKKQQSTDERVEDLANDAELRYDIDDLDPLFNEAARIVTESGKASASLIQRRLDVGYARAARILDQLENEGYVGSAHGSSPRDVLKTQVESDE